MNHFAELPLPFWLTCLAIIGGVFQAWEGRRAGWGLPAMAVFTTLTAWYVVDVIYNDYASYVRTIGASALSSAWWQVLLFAVSFMILAPLVQVGINGSLKSQSHVLKFWSSRMLEHPVFQRRLDHIAVAIFYAWALLMAIAVISVGGDILGLFAPYLGHKANPWARDRMGGGFDSIISLASYIQLFLTSGLGVIAALSFNKKIRTIAILLCILSLPYYIFDRTRNTMIAAVLPGFLAWVMLRIRSGIHTKVAVLAVAFLMTSAWFSFVMANRSSMGIATAFSNTSTRSESSGTHEGLNMLEELAWINDFIDRGTYRPNWGARYFAEAVNPIPRAIWKDKPTIGMDYALVRGFGGGSDESGGVTASISTGMIGQGVVNFGTFLGPPVAAMLMALWVALLARQDLQGSDPGRLLLYGSGLVLTFNLGRDITLLTIYPMLFGILILRALRFFYQERRPPPTKGHASSKSTRVMTSKPNRRRIRS